MKEAPAYRGDMSKVRDFVEIIDRLPLLVSIVDHFCFEMCDVSGLKMLQAMLRKRRSTYAMSFPGSWTSKLEVGDKPTPPKRRRDSAV